jgi:hypothetical protein
MVERQRLKDALLELLGDGRDHGDAEMLQVLGRRFELAPEQLAQRHEHSNESIFGNELDWAKSELSRERLVLRVKPKLYRLTRRKPNTTKEGPP